MKTASWKISPREQRDLGEYRLTNVIRRMVEGDGLHGGLEAEVSAEISNRVGQKPQGIYVPLGLLTRDLTVGTATAGGHTVATDLLASSTVELLRNRSVCAALGARQLSGLVGNVAVPRQTSGATSYWVAEGGAVTESQAAFDQVALSPKTVGAFTDISRRLLKQSSLDIENFVKGDLAANLALAIDLAALNGSGASNQPTGLLNTSGISETSGAISWANLVALETAGATANAAELNPAYLINPAQLGALKTTLKASGISGYIMESAGAQQMPFHGQIGGVRVAVSGQMPAGKIAYSSDWSELAIASWGVLDINVDTATFSSSGGVRIVALQDVDIAVRHAASFAVLTVV